MAQPATQRKAPAKQSSKQPKRQSKLLTLVGTPKAGKAEVVKAAKPASRSAAPKVDGRKAHKMGPCPRCGKQVAFFPTGTARPHIAPNSPTSQRCPATPRDVYELLADVLTQVQAERAILRDLSQEALDFAKALVDQSEAYVAASKLTSEAIQKVTAEVTRMAGEAKTTAP